MNRKLRTVRPRLHRADPELGAVELWRMRALNLAHPFHIHLAPFQVLSTGGKDISGPYNAGSKDTVNLDSLCEAQVLIKFEGYRGKYDSTATTSSTRT